MYPMEMMDKVTMIKCHGNNFFLLVLRLLRKIKSKAQPPWIIAVNIGDIITHCVEIRR